MHKLIPTAVICAAARSALNDIYSHKEDYLNSPEAAFSRKPSLDFDTVFNLPYDFSDKSIVNTIPKLLKKQSIDPAASSLTEARQKIKASAYKNAFYAFNRATRRNRLFKGYKVYALDGSEAKLYGSKNPHASKEDREADPYVGKTKGGKTRRFVHINALYDVIEKTYVDFILQPGSEKNEDDALIEYVRRLAEDAERFILCADRGYENLMAFYIMQILEQLYVIRIKDETSNGAFTKDFNLPDTKTYDVTRECLLKKDHCFALLRKLGETRPMKYIAAHEKYHEFDNEEYLVLKIRIVRFCITDASGQEKYFTIATNLAREEFSAEDIAEIYRMRWNIETSFRSIKYDLSLEHLHSRHKDLIEQEIYAAAFNYNVASRVRNAVQALCDKKLQRKQERKDKQKEECEKRVSLSYVISCLRAFGYSMSAGEAGLVQASIERRLYSYKPGRPDERKKE